MKNLVELSQQELDTVSGGGDRGAALAQGILASGPWYATILCLLCMNNPRCQTVVLDYGDVALASVAAFGIHIAEIAVIYGIGKELKKLYQKYLISK